MAAAEVQENCEYSIKEQALRNANLIIMKKQNNNNLLFNRRDNSYLYECCVAYELGIYMYKDVPPRFFNNAPNEYKKYSMRDMGIDCVSGDFTVAVQAKFYSPGNNMNWTEVSTFNSLCDSFGTVKRRIIATPENVKILGPKENLNNEHVIISDEIFLKFYDKASKFNKRPPKNINNIPLYPWQKNAFVDLSERLSRINVASANPIDSHVKLCASCASGKTRVVAELIYRGGHHPCIIFASSPLLVDQTLAEIKKWIPPTIKITSVLDSDKKADIYVSSYQSNKKVAKMTENINNEFKLCVIDEAHHVEDVFDGKNPATATISSKNMLNNINKQRTLMVSANLNDPNCDYIYDIAQAIQDGTIVDFGVILYEGENVANFIKNENTLSRIIAYCSKPDEMNVFTNKLKSAGILFGVVDTNIPKREIIEIEKQLEDGKIQVIVTSKLYKEGTNLPFADTCLFIGSIARKKIHQCIGRVLRNYPGKMYASVVFTSMKKDDVLELGAIDDRFRSIKSVDDMRSSTNPRICCVSE